MNSKVNNKTSWRCVKHGCAATFVTYDEIVEIKRRITHDHSPTFHDSLDECSVEIIEIRLDPTVKAAKHNSINNGDDSESSTGKSKTSEKPIKKMSSGDKKPKQEGVGTDDDSLDGSRTSIRKREPAPKSRLSMFQQEKKIHLSRRSDSSPHLRPDSDSSFREARRDIQKRVSSGGVIGRISKRRIE